MPNGGAQRADRDRASRASPGPIGRSASAGKAAVGIPERLAWTAYAPVGAQPPPPGGVMRDQKRASGTFPRRAPHPWRGREGLAVRRAHGRGRLLAVAGRAGRWVGALLTSVGLNTWSVTAAGEIRRTLQLAKTLTTARQKTCGQANAEVCHPH